MGTTGGYAVYDDRAWLNHLASAGLETVTIEDYYLGDDKEICDLYNESVQERIINELFRDAIAVNAIALPAYCSFDDFSIAVQIHSKDPGTFSYRIGVRHAALPEPVFTDINTYAQSTTRYTTTAFVEEIDEDAEVVCTFDTDVMISGICEAITDFLGENGYVVSAHNSASSN